MSSIREAAPADAAALLALKHALDRESRFMLLEPDERADSDADERARLAVLSGQPNSVVLVAEDHGALIGYVEASGGTFRRNQRTAYVVIGVRASHAGRGIGTGLLTALDTWAIGAGLHRLELTVMAHNRAAIGLYHKVGYQSAAPRSSSTPRLLMAKLLAPPEPAAGH